MDDARDRRRAPTHRRVSPDGLRKEVFGFLPYWELSTARPSLDYAQLSTIAYFGVGASANGTLEKTTSGGSTTRRLERLDQLAHDRRSSTTPTATGPASC